MTQPPEVVAGTQPAEEESSTVPIEAARDALRAFSRALKAHQLYLPNNPMYAKATEAAIAAFAELWKQTDELVVEVGETEFTADSQLIFEEPEKTSESLSWTFFKDGIRELRFTSGFEEEEMQVVLDLLQRARSGQGEGEDVLTLLSEHDFTTLQYRFVEEGTGEFPIDTIDSPVQLERFEPEAETEESGRPSGIVRMEDYDSTLYFLDESEIAYLRSGIAREFATDPRPAVIAALLDTFEQQPDTSTRDEIITALDSLLILLLSGSHLRDVAYLLREAAATAARAPNLSEPQRQWLEGLPDRLSEEPVLRQLFEALERTPLEPAPGDVYELFGLLGPAALAPIFEHLGRTANPELARLLEGAADRISRSYTAEVIRLIESENMAVAVGAISRAAAMKMAAGVPVLSQVLTHALADDLRLAAVEALSEIGSPGALQALEKVVTDSERDIRVAAVRALAQRAYRPALPRVERAIRSKALRESNLGEKIAFFEAYGTLAGDGGVDLLDEILNGRARLGRRADPELRACAAAGLARITSKRSREALKRAADEKDAVVRNAVRRALRAPGP